MVMGGLRTVEEIVVDLNRKTVVREDGFYEALAELNAIEQLHIQEPF